MFEKEAEEYATTGYDKKLLTKEQITVLKCGRYDGFQKGAEFGYNKAKVEVEESYRESLCNSELNLASVTEQLEELEKANEWHYVKDGDLPKEFDKPYLCYLNGYFEVGYFMAYKEQPWHFDNYYLDNEDVDAWKEIVLPELPKEIE